MCFLISLCTSGDITYSAGSGQVRSGQVGVLTLAIHPSFMNNILNLSSLVQKRYQRNIVLVKGSRANSRLTAGGKVKSRRGGDQQGVLWKTVRLETSWAARAGTACTAEAPVPTTPTLLPDNITPHTSHHHIITPSQGGIL